MSGAAPLEGRVTIVTGAGRGLGREYALTLARLGSKVLANDAGTAEDGAGNDPGPAVAVANEIRAAGGEAIPSTGRVEVQADVDEMVAQALGAWGRIDSVVNNAGILRDTSFAKMTDQSWLDVVRVHLEGTYRVTRTAWPHLVRSRAGRVVMITSHSGLFGNFGQANYSAAKMGVIGLVNTLAIEGSKHGLCVNAVAPLARTRLSQLASDPEVFDALDTSGVATVVAYLCSDSCRDTGMVLGVAGRLVQRYVVGEQPAVAFAPGSGPVEMAKALAGIVNADHVAVPSEESWRRLVAGA